MGAKYCRQNHQHGGAIIYLQETIDHKELNYVLLNIVLFAYTGLQMEILTILCTRLALILNFSFKNLNIEYSMW